MSEAVIIRCYDDLIEAFRARVAEIGVTMEALDALTGLQSGYCGKLLGLAQVKTLGPLSFNLLLESLALELVPQGNADIAERMKARWEKRERPMPMQGRVSKRAIERFMPEVAREMSRRGASKGGKNRFKRMSPYQIRMMQRKAAKARWHKWKSTRKTSPTQSK